MAIPIDHAETFFLKPGFWELYISALQGMAEQYPSHMRDRYFWPNFAALLTAGGKKIFTPRAGGGLSGSLKAAGNLIDFAGQPFLERDSNGEWYCVRPLCVTETRLLSYEIPQVQRQPISGEKRQLRTDLHTHFRGQLTRKDIDEILKLHPEILFKKDTVAKGGITLERDMRWDEIPPDMQQTILQRMFLPTDTCWTHVDMDRGYSLQYPVYEQQFPLCLERIVKGYMERGITHAELSTTLFLQDPEKINESYEFLHSLEQQKEKMHIRFLCAVVNESIAKMTQEEFASLCNRLDVILAHPACTGIDIVGLELYKYNNFIKDVDHKKSKNHDKYNKRLQNLAEIAVKHDKVLRVHSGETSKNTSNISAILKLAEDNQDLKIRIGHGLYGLNKLSAKLLKRAKKLSDAGRLLMEIIPDSNIALCNLIDLAQLPLKDFLRKGENNEDGIRCVIGSDGAGLYGTTAEQLVATLELAGCGSKEFEAIKAAEDAYINNLKPLPERADPIALAETKSQHKKEKIELPSPQVDLQGKIPVIIIGSQGSSWRRLSIDEKGEMKKSLRGFIETLDPQRHCIMLGRQKDSGGIYAELKDIIAEAGFPISTYTFISRDAVDPEKSADPHTIVIAAESRNVPEEIVWWAGQNPGASIVAFGGGTYTIQTAFYAMHAGVLVLLDPNGGASGELARFFPSSVLTANSLMLTAANLNNVLRDTTNS